jgi:thioredoxin 1
MRGVEMTKVIEVTDQNFEEEVLESDVPTEVDFWAPWCGPCHMVSPIYDKLSEEYGDFKFCKIDVDQNPQTARHYNIVSIPMQMFFANGEKVDEILGAVPEHMIRSKVAEILQRYPTDEKGMIKVILGSWIEQSKRHGEKFEKWKERAGNSGGDGAYGPLFEAVRRVEEANEQLSKALVELQDKR